MTAAERIGFEGATLFAVSRADDVALGLTFHRSGATELETADLIADTPLAVLVSVDAVSGETHRVVADAESADWSRDNQLAVVRPVDEVRPPGEYASTALEWPIGKILYKTQPQPVRLPKPFRPPAILQPHSLTDIRISPDNRLVGVIERQTPSSLDGDVIVIDASSGQKTTLLSQLSYVRGLAWSQDGHELVFAGSFRGGDVSIQSVDLAGNTKLHRFRGAPIPSGELIVQDVSPKGDLLVSAVPMYATGIRSYELATGAQRSVFRREFPYDSSRHAMSGLVLQDTDIVLAELSESGPSAVVVMKRSAQVVKGASSYVQRADGTTVVQLEGLVITSLSPDGTSVIAVNDRGKLLIVPISDSTIRRRISAPSQIVHAAKWFHDGRRVLAVAESNDDKEPSLLVLDSLGGQPLHISHHGVQTITGGSSVFTAAISSDDRFVAVLNRDFNIAIIAADGTSERILPGTTEEQQEESKGDLPAGFSAPRFYEPLRWSPDGRHLYILDGNRTSILRVNPVSGARETIIHLDRAHVGVEPLSLEITTDGTLCAYAFSTPVSKLFRIRAGAW